MSKVKKLWESCSTIRHSGDLLWFWQWNGTARSHKLKKKQKIFQFTENQLKMTMLITFSKFISTFSPTVIISKKFGTVLKFQFLKYCPKKRASFHCNYELEKGLVLWCAASEVKMEVRFEISVKFCIRSVSLALFCKVWKKSGTSYWVYICFKIAYFCIHPIRSPPTPIVITEFH